MCIFGAHADNNNTATSKDYVDAQIATLQDEIPAIDSNTVLTHTGTSGEIGSKKIYDENSDYASQQNALVTAGIFNSAVQNAIETEFVCIDWLGEHVPSNCLLWQIHSNPAPLGLPSGYTQLEYLESTGTQWIDTGIRLISNNVTYEWSAKDKGPNGSSLFGSQGNGVYSGILYTSNNTSCQAYIGYTSGQNTINYSIDFNNFYTWKFVISSNNLSTLIQNGNILSQIAWNGSLYKSGNIFLYANNVAGRGAIENASVSYKYFKIIDNGALVLNFIPARRDSDGELGMYDTVSNTFFTNSGTGEFIAGPVASYLPQSN